MTTSLVNTTEAAGRLHARGKGRRYLITLAPNAESDPTYDYGEALGFIDDALIAMNERLLNIRDNGVMMLMWWHSDIVTWETKFEVAINAPLTDFLAIVSAVSPLMPKGYFINAVRVNGGSVQLIREAIQRASETFEAMEGA